MSTRLISKFPNLESILAANYIARPDYDLIKGKNSKEDELSDVVYDSLIVLNVESGGDYIGPTSKCPTNKLFVLKDLLGNISFFFLCFGAFPR